MDDYPEVTPALKPLRPRRRPSTLYHYTSGAGLLGILSLKTIWATNIRFLNDSSEYELAFDLAQKIVFKHKAAVRSNYDKAFYEVLESRICEETGPADVYVTSFSENADQLSQWRAYTPAAGGYALGIKPRALANAALSGFDRFLARCVYDPVEQRSLIEGIVVAVEAVAERNRREGLSHDRVYREAHKLLGRLLSIAAPALKDRGFAEEQEWRLISRGTCFNGAHPQFRPGRSTLVPYFAHSLVMPRATVPFHEIVIGPTTHTGLSQQAIHALLLAEDLASVTTRFSAIPFREW